MTRRELKRRKGKRRTEGRRGKGRWEHVKLEQWSLLRASTWVGGGPHLPQPIAALVAERKEKSHTLDCVLGSGFLGRGLALHSLAGAPWPGSLPL